MSVVFEKTKLLTDKQFHYCPGATTASYTAWLPRPLKR